MKRFPGTATLCVDLAPMAQAETIRSNSFVGEIQRRPGVMQAPIKILAGVTAKTAEYEVLCRGGN